MSSWNEVPVNGALVDSLVVTFDGPNSNSIPRDYVICVDTIYFSSDAPVAVRIFLANTVGATEDNRITIFDTAGLGVNRSQWMGPAFEVPFDPGQTVPMHMRITKGASNAKIRLHWSLKPPGVC
jgi:hypothetical protein